MVEQPKARQARLERLHEHNKEQLNRPKQGKLGLHESRRLVDKEGKLKDSLRHKASFSNN